MKKMKKIIDINKTLLKVLQLMPSIRDCNLY